MQGDYKNAKRKRKKKFILLIIIFKLQRDEMQGDYNKMLKEREKKKFILLIIIKKANNKDLNVGKNIINKKKSIPIQNIF